MKLRYFAWVRERIGKPEEDIDLPANVATVAELIAWLAGRGEELRHDGRAMVGDDDNLHAVVEREVGNGGLLFGVRESGKCGDVDQHRQREGIYLPGAPVCPTGVKCHLWLLGFSLCWDSDPHKQYGHGYPDGISEKLGRFVANEKGRNWTVMQKNHDQERKSTRICTDRWQASTTGSRLSMLTGFIGCVRSI